MILCNYIKKGGQANYLKGTYFETAYDWPASIAATGLKLAIYPIAVELGFITRDTAVQKVLITLRFFWNSMRGTEPDSTGYHGQPVTNEWKPERGFLRFRKSIWLGFAMALWDQPGTDYSYDWEL